MQATRSFSHYKNIHIPPIGCQRLISLHDRLFVNTPSAKRPKVSTEYFLKQVTARDEGFDDTVSSVIEAPMSEDNYSENASPHSKNSRVELPLLVEIFKKVETPFQNHAETLSTASTVDQKRLFGRCGRSNRFSAAGAKLQTRLSVPEKKDSRIHLTGVKNGADDSRKGAGASKSSLALTLSTPANDLTMEMIGSAAEVRSSLRPYRRSSQFSINRPSKYGASNMSLVCRGGPANSQQITSPHSLMNNSQTGQGRTVQNVEKRNPAFLGSLRKFAKHFRKLVKRQVTKDRGPARCRQDVSAISAKKESPRHQPIAIQHHDVASLPFVEGVVVRNACPSLLDRSTNPSLLGKDSMTNLSLAESIITGDSTLGSCNSSCKESADARNFPAALKKDSYASTQTLINGDNTLHSKFKYKHPSVVEELALPEQVEPAGNQAWAEASNVLEICYPDRLGTSSKCKTGSLDAELYENNQRVRQKSRFALNKDCSHDRRYTVNDNVGMHSLAGKHSKSVSQASRLDMPPWYNKGKASTKCENQIESSVMALNGRAHATKDRRFSISGKLERMGNQDESSAIPENDYIQMTVAMAGASYGPFRRYTSVFDITCSEPRSSTIIDSEKCSCLDVTKASAQQLGSSKPESRTYNIADSGIHSQHSKRSTSSKCIQMDLKSNNIGLQTSVACSQKDVRYLEVPAMSHMQTWNACSSEQSALLARQERESVVSKVDIPRPSQSFQERHVSTLKPSWTSPLCCSSYSASAESLVPLLSPLSGTVVGSLAAVASARALSKKTRPGADATQFLSKDTDIEPPSYDARSVSGIPVTHNGQVSSLITRDNQPALLEVKAIDINTNNFKIFTWRNSALTTCRYSSATPSFGFGDRMYPHSHKLCHITFLLFSRLGIKFQ